jgi:hypothetical protein
MELGPFLDWAGCPAIDDRNRSAQGINFAAANPIPVLNRGGYMQKAPGNATADLSDPPRFHSKLANLRFEQAQHFYPGFSLQFAYTSESLARNAA